MKAADPILVDRPQPDWWTGDEWSTPESYFEIINAKYGPFDLDPCARVMTAKAPAFFTKEQNGLEQPWFGKVWVNPPYSQPSRWCAKAAAEQAVGNTELIVMLLPAAVDTNWFHEYVVPYAKVEFIRGRLRFCDWTGQPSKGSPMGGNVLAIYS